MISSTFPTLRLDVPLCPVGSHQGPDYTAAAKEVMSDLEPAPGGPQESWQAVPGNSRGTFVPRDLLSISFIGVALWDSNKQ